MTSSPGQTLIRSVTRKPLAHPTSRTRSPGRGYVQVDTYRSEAEREIFLGWVLTAVTFLRPEEWRALFAEAGYTGDYYWTVLDPDPEWNDFNAPATEPRG